MKKIFVTLFLFLCLTNTTRAAFEDVTKGLQDVGKQTQYKTSGVTETSLASTIGGIINLALAFLGIVFVLLIIYAGVLWMIAGGDDNKVTKAKNIIKNSSIGLAIVLLSYAIAAFVESLFK